MTSMFEYINAVKRGFRDQHGFKPTGGNKNEPLFSEGVIPDGEYPMTLFGKVKLLNGAISCCNFEDDEK